MVNNMNKARPKPAVMESRNAENDPGLSNVDKYKQRLKTDKRSKLTQKEVLKISV